jgi:hypothetical protein
MDIRIEIPWESSPRRITFRCESSGVAEFRPGHVVGPSGTMSGEDAARSRLEKRQGDNQVARGTQKDRGCGGAGHRTMGQTSMFCYYEL